MIKWNQNQNQNQYWSIEIQNQNQNQNLPIKIDQSKSKVLFNLSPIQKNKLKIEQKFEQKFGWNQNLNLKKKIYDSSLLWW